MCGRDCKVIKSWFIVAEPLIPSSVFEMCGHDVHILNVWLQFFEIGKSTQLCCFSAVRHYNSRIRKSRIVVIKSGNKLSELSERLVIEFGLTEDDNTAALSYWPGNICDFVTGSKIPHVLLTSDGALDFFVSQLRLNKSLTLCVKFITSGKRKSNGFSQSSGYTTPVIDSKRRCVFSSPASNTNSNHTVPSKFLHDEDVGLPSVGSKTNYILTDDELIKGVEIAEALFAEFSGKRKDTDFAESSGKRKESESDTKDEEDRFGTESIPDFDLGIDDVNDTRPRGYNIDFWGKFIDNVVQMLSKSCVVHTK
ncbi:unnamed protein product [Arabis nemorensis]|uniref:Uncharacterized protein n=1 Tax=Arabis nemorensis TaxID=586526 RepID=A0A565CRX4_9BRAS|nr:unnamed protein product [Arabis nemorensis]